MPTAYTFARATEKLEGERVIYFLAGRSKKDYGLTLDSPDKKEYPNLMGVTQNFAYSVYDDVRNLLEDVKQLKRLATGFLEAVAELREEVDNLQDRVDYLIKELDADPRAREHDGHSSSSTEPLEVEDWVSDHVRSAGLVTNSQRDTAFLAKIANKEPN